MLRGIPPSPDGFCLSASKGDLERVKKDIASGVNINYRGEYGTAVTLAARFDYEEVVKFLIDKGANLNIPDYRGNTVIHYLKSYDLALYSIQKGANVNAKNKQNSTPLISASRNGNLKLVKLLVFFGAEINTTPTTEEEPSTPLSIAEEKGYIDIIEFLKNPVDFEEIENWESDLLNFLKTRKESDEAKEKSEQNVSEELNNKSSVPETTNFETEKASKSGDCFIATAAYNDYDHPNVKLFRIYRDNHLRKSKIGNFVVKVYYLVGPEIAKVVSKNRFLKQVSIRILNLIARTIR